jgi:hypothetical protein
MTVYYTPDPLMLPWGITCCQHCGCRSVLHHRDMRCYTTHEIGERLRVYQHTGLWPLDDDWSWTPQEATP